MSFESNGTSSFSERSPGGFEFGVMGWTWGPPVPRTITFFLDGSVMVCDQYGRQIRRSVRPDGTELRFAECAPEANQEGVVVPRPQYGTHVQVVEALLEEKVDWLSYEVRYRDRSGANRSRAGLTLAAAQKEQARLLGDNYNPVLICRTVVSAGWPQLPYAELKKLPEVPPTPISELLKILDPHMRNDAIKFKREVDALREKATQLEE